MISIIPINQSVEYGILFFSLYFGIWTIIYKDSVKAIGRKIKKALHKEKQMYYKFIEYEE